MAPEELTPGDYLDQPFPSGESVPQSIQRKLDHDSPVDDAVWKIKRLEHRYLRSLEYYRYREVILSRVGFPFNIAVAANGGSNTYANYLERVVNLSNRDFLANGSPSLLLESQIKSKYWETFSLVCDSHKGNGTKTWQSLRDQHYDWDKSKKCFCIITFVSPGIIQWDKLNPPSSGSAYLHTNPTAHYLVRELQKSMNASEASAGILTDGVFTLLLNAEVIRRFPPTWIYAERFAACDLSASHLIAERVYTEAMRTGLCTRRGSYVPCRPHQGAMNSPPLSDIPEAWESRSAFDIYAMQRVPAIWDRFMTWHNGHSNANPLQVGDSLAIKPRSLQDENALWRCRWDPKPLPEETQAIVTEHRRTRSADIDDILNTSKPLAVSFVITEIVPSARTSWSKVFFGRLLTRNPNSQAETSSQTDTIVCLKLYDERYFKLPEEPDYSDSQPAGRLLDLDCAEDMARGEESVYSRLEDLQGLIIPHSYGFHKFTLPDRWRAYGMIMERIYAPTLSNTEITELPEALQRDFVLRLRHAVRALKFAGVSQRDWHLDQILCPRAPGSAPGSENILPVLIDFAFALQDLGETDYRPRDFMELCKPLVLLESELEVSGSLLDECWLPALDEER